jgi:hypothetical protein
MKGEGPFAPNGPSPKLLAESQQPYSSTGWASERFTTAVSSSPWSS